MNFRQQTMIRIEAWRKIQTQAQLVVAAALVSGVVAGLITIGIQSSWIAVATIGLVVAIAFGGVLLRFKVVWSVRNTLRCPRCGRKLGYLLLDPSYSKSSYAALRLPDFPEAIKECPYCRFDFDAPAEPQPEANSSIQNKESV